MFVDPHRANGCVRVSSVRLGAQRTRCVGMLDTHIYYTPYLCTLVYGISCVQSLIHTDDVVARVIHSFHCEKKPTTKTYTNIRIFVNVCESSFLYHTKWFSIHMMGRMLTPFLLQLLLLLLFVRTYIYLPCRFSWILAIDILFGRHTSNLDVLFPFVSCLRFPFC